MKYTHIEGIEKPVSRIVFGCSNDNMNGGGDFSEVLDNARWEDGSSPGAERTSSSKPSAVTPPCCALTE